MTARIRCFQKQWVVQIGYNPANLICKPMNRKGFYKVRTWPTEDEAEQWITERGYEVEQ